MSRHSATPGRVMGSHQGSVDRGLGGRRNDDKNDNMDEEEEEQLDEVICAIDRHGQYLGCSVYSEAEQKLSLMEDIAFPGPEFISTRKTTTLGLQ